MNLNQHVPNQTRPTELDMSASTTARPLSLLLLLWFLISLPEQLRLQCLHLALPQAVAELRASPVLESKVLASSRWCDRDARLLPVLLVHKRVLGEPMHLRSYSLLIRRSIPN